MAGTVNEDARADLRDDGYSLRAERVRGDGGLGEAFGVVLEPEEEHALW